LGDVNLEGMERGEGRKEGEAGREDGRGDWMERSEEGRKQRVKNGMGEGKKERC
jgi:hypothetical protein